VFFLNDCILTKLNNNFGVFKKIVINRGMKMNAAGLGPLCHVLSVSSQRKSDQMYRTWTRCADGGGQLCGKINSQSQTQLMNATRRATSYQIFFSQVYKTDKFPELKKRLDKVPFSYAQPILSKAYRELSPSQKLDLEDGGKASSKISSAKVAWMKAHQDDAEYTGLDKDSRVAAMENSWRAMSGAMKNPGIHRKKKEKRLEGAQVFPTSPPFPGYPPPAGYPHMTPQQQQYLMMQQQQMQMQMQQQYYRQHYSQQQQWHPQQQYLYPQPGQHPPSQQMQGLPPPQIGFPPTNQAASVHHTSEMDDQLLPEPDKVPVKKKRSQTSRKAKVKRTEEVVKVDENGTTEL
jgi:hypothetical protein